MHGTEPIALGVEALLERLACAGVGCRAARRNHAGEAERRRIASDLHDGVVQELTGVSLGLAAIGRAEEVSRTQVLEASSAIRNSIKSLRSLLVEIYPPNLHEEGLESALTDLVAPLEVATR